MNQKAVFVGGEEFTCQQFNGGIDIYSDGKFIGEIEGAEIPDIDDDDDDAEIVFDKEVEEWLDDNYFN